MRRTPTYAGGACKLADFDHVQLFGADRVHVTIGSALNIFGPALRYEDCVAFNRAGKEGVEG